jgi:hypothetical protein
VPVLARMEQARHQGRPADPVAPFGRFRPEGMARLEDEITSSPASASPSARPSSSATSCSARWACRAGARPRPAMVHRRRVLEESGWPRPRAAAQDPRLAPALQAEIDLYRRAAGLHPSRDGPRPHLLCAGRHHDRAAVLLRAQPAEHPDPHGEGRPQDPHRLRRREGHEADLGRLQPDRAARARPHRRHPAAAQAFEDGIDIHAMTASEMFGVPVEGMTGRGAPARQGDQFRHHLRHLGLRARQPARHPARGGGDYIKPISSASPASATIWTRPRLRRENGYVETIFGRRAIIPKIRSSNPSMRAFNERAAINAPIQGSAADIIRRAMIRMDGALAGCGAEVTRACCCRSMTN